MVYTSKKTFSATVMRTGESLPSPGRISHISADSPISDAARDPSRVDCKSKPMQTCFGVCGPRVLANLTIATHPSSD